MNNEFSHSLCHRTLCQFIELEQRKSADKRERKRRTYPMLSSSTAEELEDKESSDLSAPSSHQQWVENEESRGWQDGDAEHR
jgi:hypothetical protein